MQNNSCVTLFVLFVTTLFSLNVTSPAQASSVITAPQNHISDFPGEYIGLQTRKLALVYQDVVIPGNGGLDIVVTRRQSGDKVNFTPLKLVVSRQNSVSSPLMNTNCLGEFNKLSVVYEGNHLVPAGFETGANLPSGIIAAFNNNAFVSCDATQTSVPVLNLSNGHKITLQVLRSVTHSAGHYRIYGIDTLTDKYNNTISYIYEDDIQTNMSKRIKQIKRNDNVTVNFVYDQADQYFSYVKEIKYLQAKIQYQYTNRHLTSVIDQANRTTTYEYATYTGIGDQVHKITMPNGMHVEYNHGALYDNGFRLPDRNGNFSLADFGYSGGSLNFKTITGPGLEPQRYTFQNLAGNRVLVTQFNYDGDKDLSTEYTFELATFSNLNGKTTQIRRFSGVLSNEGDPRDALTDHPLVYQQNLTYHGINNTHKCEEVTAIALQPLDCTRYFVSTEQLTIGADTFNKSFQSFNQFGQVTQWQESFGNNTRVHQSGYDHDLTNWILNQPTTSSIGPNSASQTEVKRYEYYAKDHSTYPFHLYQEYQYGLLQRQYTDYYSHGEVKKVEFNEKLTFGDTSKNRYIRYENYHRGNAQKTYRPSRTASGEIFTELNFSDEDFGHNQQLKDGNGNITDYGYDHLGRPIYIDPQDSNIADTLITYNNGYVPQKTITYSTTTQQRCELSATKDSCINPIQTNTTWHDRNNNIVLSKVSDGTKSIYSQAKFNIFSKKTYQGLDTFTEPDLTQTTTGVYTQYDPLQRPTQVTHSAGGSISRNYLTGNKIQQTDANSNVTTTTYLAYGKPMYSTATKIESPESLTTTINVNTLGKTTQITQSGLRNNDNISQNEYRLYDSYQRLCMTKRTDVGNEYFHYNNLGQIDWTAQGVIGNSCQTHGTSASQKVTYHYDNQGALNKISFGDNTPTKTYTRDNNGNVVAIDTLDYSQTYQYNSADLITKEQIDLFASLFNVSFDYAYDSLGNVQSIRYPNNANPINFAPNRFGQPTQVTRQENGTNNIFIYQGINYHPNGTIDSYTYGNDIEHKTTLNAHQLPSNLLDQKTGDNAVLNLSYEYDLNNNVSAILNSKSNNIYSLTNLAYDGLNRLTSTSGGSAIGESTISYDSLGNILSYRNTSSEKPHNLNYQYDSNFRLIGLTGNGSGEYDFEAAGSANSDQFDSYNSRGSVIHNGKRSFDYNLANQMIKSGDNTYLYDGHNRRVKESTSNGTKFSYYNHAGQLLYRQTPQGSIHYIYLEGKLIAKEIIDIIPSENSQNHYKPFGETINASKDDIGYTGHKFDVELNLNYMQARYYDPAIGRFYSNDPIGFRDIHSFNRFAYANNNPYKYIDPDGLAPDFVTARRTRAIVRVLTPKKYKGMVDKWTKGSQISSLVEAGKHKEATQMLKKVMNSRLRSSKTFAGAKTDLKKRNDLCEYCSENKASQVDHIDPVADYVEAVLDGLLSFGEAEDMVNSIGNYADSCGGKTGTCNQNKGKKKITDYKGKKESTRIRNKRRQRNQREDEDRKEN